MYLYVPAEYKRYVENMFYASFPTSDLKMIKWVNSVPQGEKYLKFSKDYKFYETSEFSKWWSYVDPFKDLLSMFFSVPEEASATLVWSSVFNQYIEMFYMFLTNFYIMGQLVLHPKNHQ